MTHTTQAYLNEDLPAAADSLSRPSSIRRSTPPISMPHTDSRYPTRVDLPESTWPMKTTFRWHFDGRSPQAADGAFPRPAGSETSIRWTRADSCCLLCACPASGTALVPTEAPQTIRSGPVACVSDGAGAPGSVATQCPACSRHAPRPRSRSRSRSPRGRRTGRARVQRPGEITLAVPRIHRIQGFAHFMLRLSKTDELPYKFRSPTDCEI